MDNKTIEKIKIFESNRMRELYAHMISFVNEIPDFKTKLLYLQRAKPKLVPGFGESVKDNMPHVRIPIPDLQKWFDV